MHLGIDVEHINKINSEIIQLKCFVQKDQNDLYWYLFFVNGLNFKVKLNLN